MTWKTWRMTLPSYVEASYHDAGCGAFLCVAGRVCSRSPLGGTVPKAFSPERQPRIAARKQVPNKHRGQSCPIFNGLC